MRTRRHAYTGVFGMRHSVHSRWSLRYWIQSARRLFGVEGGSFKW